MIKNITFFVLFSLLFSGCFDKNVTEEDCLSKGMILKKEKVLNYRTGKYEERYFCAKRK